MRKLAALKPFSSALDTQQSGYYLTEKLFSPTKILYLFFFVVIVVIIQRSNDHDSAVISLNSVLCISVFENYK